MLPLEDMSGLQSQLLASEDTKDAAVRIHGAAVRANKLCLDRTLCKVRLEGKNPYVLLAVLTVTRDHSRQQRVSRGRRAMPRHLNPQITTASSFLKMHLPGYVVQALQTLPPAEAAPSAELDEATEGDSLDHSPLLTALVQADGALRALTQSPQPTSRDTSQQNSQNIQRRPAARGTGSQHNAAAEERSGLPSPLGATSKPTTTPPASKLLAAVAEASARDPCSSVFGDTSGSVILVDVKRQRDHTVSWGATHSALVTNTMGHVLEVQSRQEHCIHGATVRAATYSRMHGAHNIVLGTSGLWRYTHPSMAGLHAAAHCGADTQLSTSEHQHDPASAIVRAALRRVVARCAAAPAARTAVLNTLAQLDRLAPGSKREAYRDRLVPRRRGDVHPDLTAAVASITLPCSSNLLGLDSAMSGGILPPGYPSPLAPQARWSMGVRDCGGGSPGVAGSSLAQIEHMRTCGMCAFVGRHFHGAGMLLTPCDSASADHTSGSMESSGEDLTGLGMEGGELAGGQDEFLSAADGPAPPDAEDGSCRALEASTLEASEMSQKTPVLAAARFSRTAFCVPEDSAVSHSCSVVDSGPCDEESLTSSNGKVATGSSGGTHRVPGKTLTVMRGMMRGARSRDWSSHTSLHACSQSISCASRSSAMASSFGSFQKMQADRSEAQRRWALLARHAWLLVLQQEIRRKMWSSAVHAAQVALLDTETDARSVMDTTSSGAGSNVAASSGVGTPTPEPGTPQQRDAEDIEAHSKRMLQRVASGVAQTHLLGVSCDLGTPGAVRGGRRVLPGAVEVGRPPVAAFGCRKLRVDSTGFAGMAGAASMLDDECSAALGNASMMGGASILE